MPKLDRELAKMLYPKASEIVDEGLGSRVQSTYAYGTAASDSSGGSVDVIMDGETAGVDAAIQVPTSCAIKEGDTVLVTVNGNVPVEAVSKGSGDVTRTIAEEAQSVANATSQYFWHDSNGAHVSTVADDPEGTSNSLWNSLGLLIRKAANILVSITSSAIAFYDGSGNNSSNIVASFGSSGAQIGYTADTHVTVDSNSLDIMDSSTTVASFSGNRIDLGADDDSARIVFCNDTGLIRKGSAADGEQGLYVGGDEGLFAEGKYSAIESGYTRNNDGGLTVLPDIEYGGHRVRTRISAHHERLDSLDATDFSATADIRLTADDGTLPNATAGSQISVSSDDIYLNTNGAYFHFTGVGNIRNNDSLGNATHYFVKYPVDYSETILTNRNTAIWQNASGNVHLRNGTDSSATWEYSFEAGGLYRRTKSGGSWTSWTNIG